MTPTLVMEWHLPHLYNFGNSSGFVQNLGHASQLGGHVGQLSRFGSTLTQGPVIGLDGFGPTCTGANPLRQNPSCNHCKKVGHVKEACFLLVGYPPIGGLNSMEEGRKILGGSGLWLTTLLLMLLHYPTFLGLSISMQSKPIPSTPMMDFLLGGGAYLPSPPSPSSFGHKLLTLGSVYRGPTRLNLTIDQESKLIYLLS